MNPAMLPSAAVSEALLACLPPAIDVFIEVADPLPAWREVGLPPHPYLGVGPCDWPARLPSLDVVPIAVVAETF